jgi:hypothetical protein
MHCLEVVHRGEGVTVVLAEDPSAGGQRLLVQLPSASEVAQVATCGSPATCWRRLTGWATAGVFDQLHLEVLDRLGEQGRLDWSRPA